MRLGEEAFRDGQIEESTIRWQEAAAQLAESGDRNGERVALLRLAEAQQALGSHSDALVSLRRALAIASESDDALAIATVRGALGNLYISLGAPAEARRELELAAAVAASAGDAALVAATLNGLGNLLATEGDPAGADSAYARAAIAADEAQANELGTRVRANRGRLAAQQGDPEIASQILAEAFARALALPSSHDTAFMLIGIGRSTERFRARQPGEQAELLLRAYRAYAAANEMAHALGDERAAAFALGYQGALYETRGRDREALELTRRALRYARQIEGAGSAHLWLAQAGRLERRLGRANEAIADYRAAVAILGKIRHALPAQYGSSEESFQERTGHIYYGLVDLLLKRADTESDPEKIQGDLASAQQTMELLKAEELRDYFQDECVDAYRDKITNLASASRSAAILYPILLPDRLVVLLSGPDDIQQFPVAVPAERVEEEVRSFRRRLETRETREYLRNAQQLYKWLIEPAAAAISELGVDTLVFVPGGALRTIPMAALHNGTEFLIENYGIATTPGLELTDPRPIDRADMRLFLGGLSQSVQGFAPLEYVPEELAAIQALHGGELLLDDEFTTSAVKNALEKRSFSVVHIASHGTFSDEAGDSFLLTHDGRLSMDELADSVGALRYRDRPLEMITLSACETAIGNDRAALGLAGIAIKSSARSALGTLWQVNDAAASELMVEFYKQLHDPAVSRAAALQRAQLKLLRNRQYRHPVYWSPFLLISNWL